MDRLDARRVLACSPEHARSQFWDFSAWQRIWDRITRTEVHYDDGAHQEIEMTVQRDGRSERVRTVRFLLGGDIEFFSPQPPPAMDVHRGAWRFERHGDGCLVTAEREYRLTRGPDEPDGDHADRRGRYADRFQRRLDAILTCFVDHFAQPRRTA